MRLTSFALVLAASFGVGLGLGELVPDRAGTPPPVHDQHGTHSP